MRTRTTHTYAELAISPTAYDEIKKRLEDAGYHHVFMTDGTIDMFGIGLTRKSVAECDEELAARE